MKISYSTFNMNGKALKPKTRPKYGENNKTMKSNLGVFGEGVIKTHTKDCPYMTGDLDPFGEEACGCSGHQEHFVNTALLSGIYSLLDRLVNPLETGKGYITYIEVGTDATTPTPSDAGTGLSKGRKAITQAFRDTTNAVFKAFFNGTQANSSEGITASSSPENQLVLFSGQGALFREGDSIEIDGGSFTNESAVIQSIVGDTITLTANLSAPLAGGETIKQLLTEMALWGDVSASTQEGTGIAYARTTNFTPRTKETGQGLTIEWHYTIT